MSEKFTPGPWTIHQNEFCQWIGKENGKAQLARVMQPAGMTDETAQASACLIASAPELFSQLENLVRAWDNDPDGRIGVGLVNDARQAIAKAKGQP